MTTRILVILFAISFLYGCKPINTETSFTAVWDQSEVKRPWAGPDFWLNPIQAWQQDSGQLQCLVSGGDRNAVLLTREISEEIGSFSTSTSFDLISTSDPAGWIGWQVGLKGEWSDYRDDAIKGKGLCLGVSTDGQLFVGQPNKTEKRPLTGGTLTVEVTPAEDDLYNLRLELTTTQHLDTLTRQIHGSWLSGLLALTASQSYPSDTLDYRLARPVYHQLSELSKRQGGNTKVAFKRWSVSGDKVTVHPERAFGPILWAQHTLSDQVMKMSVQMAPVGDDSKVVTLHIDGRAQQQATIDKLGRNALFRIVDWDDTKDHPYTVVYKDHQDQTYTYEGTIRKNPTKEVIKMASLSCVDDRGFPHQEVVDHVMDHDPDIASFHGDQLYERVGGYGVEYNSILDYQRKWYLFGWTFRDLMRDVPTIIIPDDHDVFHGNLWGQGGKAADVSKGFGNFGQDSGGYKETPDFVNMVHRTQTGHLPDPYDDTPVLQDISVYYSRLDYGGISYAILGDRQWKTAPGALMPEALIENGWPQNKAWDPKKYANHPDAELLGPRQEKFLDAWSSGWDSDIHFKVVISQSPFCNVATLPADIWHDKHVPDLPRYRKGEYPPDDRPVADFDSNSWPQHARNKAIKMMRRVGALHITGDQHLGSTGQYGVDAYGDSGYWISSPAVANLWPRRWFPVQPANGGKERGDTRRYTGNYEDGFGNKITVRGIANPHDLDRKPDYLYDRAPGYSIIAFDKRDQTMELSVWPRWASPLASDNQPYADWPIKIYLDEGYGKQVAGYLPEIEVEKGERIHIIDQSTNQLESIRSPLPGLYAPPVYHVDKIYRVLKVKDGRNMANLSNIRAI